MFTVKAEDLSAALSLVLYSAEIKTTVPWLSYVLIDEHNGKLRLSATDMDSSISVAIDAEVKTGMAFCVKGKQLASLAALLSGDVSVETKDNQVWVTTDSVRQRLPYLPKEEFHFIDVATEEKLTISGEMLEGMLRAASIAMETNPNGQDSWKNLEMRAEGGKFSITGLCGPRASTTSIPCDGGDFYVMFPSRAVAPLMAFAAKSETVSLALSENVMTARSGENEATFKLSGQKWADWSSIAEAECEHRIEFESESFVLALKRALLAADQNRLVTRVDFRLQNKQSNLLSESLNGESDEKLTFNCPTLNGEVLPVAVNGLHLLDLFKVVKGCVVWELSQNHAALRFTPKAPLPFSFTYIQGMLRI